MLLTYIFQNTIACTNICISRGQGRVSFQGHSLDIVVYSSWIIIINFVIPNSLQYQNERDIVHFFHE